MNASQGWPKWTWSNARSLQKRSVFIKKGILQCWVEIQKALCVSALRSINMFFQGCCPWCHLYKRLNQYLALRKTIKSVKQSFVTVIFNNYISWHMFCDLPSPLPGRCLYGLYIFRAWSPISNFNTQSRHRCNKHSNVLLKKKISTIKTLMLLNSIRQILYMTYSELSKGIMYGHNCKIFLLLEPREYVTALAPFFITLLSRDYSLPRSFACHRQISVHLWP